MGYCIRIFFIMGILGEIFRGKRENCLRIKLLLVVSIFVLNECWVKKKKELKKILVVCVFIVEY